MSHLPLIIGGVVVPVESRLDFQQTFEPLVAGTDRRMADGALFSTELRWKKWKTSISAGGWILPALMGINYRLPYEIHCVQPLSFGVGEDLPENWVMRPDAPVKTITDKYGVETRLVYPILTVKSRPPRLNPGANPTWELACEEV